MEENKKENEETLQPNTAEQVPAPVSTEDLVALDESHDDHEEHVNAEEAADLAGLEEEHENYENAPLEKLQDLMNTVLADDRVKEFRKQFNQVKKRFKDIFEEEKNHLLQAFTEEGEKAEDFKFMPTPAMLKLRESIQKFGEKIAETKKRDEQMAQANFLAKQDIVHELKLLISEESDMKKAFEKFHELQDRWKAIGHVPATQAEDLNKTYYHFKDVFYNSVQLNKELYEMDQKKNLEAKQQLIRRVQGLTKVQSIKKSIEMLHAIQKEWRETGPVAKSLTKEIFDVFKESVDKIYSRRDEFLKELDEIRNKNLAAKTAICEQVEAINALEYTQLKDWKKQEEEVKKAEESWKTIGRVPQQFNESIWERFKTAKKEFYRKKYPLIKHINEELGKNYDEKVKLCERAEALSTSTDWKNTAQKLIQLQNEWKKAGVVERKKSDEIWNRFRAACDAFFQAKDQHFAGQGDREAENLVRKKELVEKVNSYAPVESLEENLAFIKETQKSWGEAGFVPIKEKAGIEKLFDEAIDALLAKMNIDKDKKHRMEYKIKIDTMLQSPQAYMLLKDERMFVSNKIRRLEEEVGQIENNLGFFGHSKGADAFKKQYEDKIAKLREELTHWEDRRTLLKNAIRPLEAK